MFGARSQEVPGARGRVTTELRDRRQQGIGVEFWQTVGCSPRLFWVNEDFGIQRGKGSRQPLVRNF